MLHLKPWHAIKSSAIIARRCLVPYQNATGKRSSASATSSELAPGQAKSVNAMPSPPSYPILGNLPFLWKSGGTDALLDILQMCASKYGKAFRLSALGIMKIYCFTDPVAFEEVYRKEGKMPRREYPVGVWVDFHKQRELSQGIFLSDGQEWYKERTALGVNLLKVKTVESYIPHFNDVSDDLLLNLHSLRDSNGEIKGMEQELFKWSLESVGSVAFDRRIGCFDSSNPDPKSMAFIDVVKDLFAKLPAAAIEIPILSKFYKTKAYRDCFKGLDAVYNYIENEIKHNLEKMKDDDKNESSELGFIPHLIFERKMEMKDLMSSITSLMFAAVETTSNSMLWTLLCLARNPEIQENLYQEIVSTLKENDKPSAEHLKHMPYIRAVVKETLRMHPVAPLNSRRFAEDTVIAGYKIPPDDIVLLCHEVASWDPEVFPEPNAFKPERWLRENESSKLINHFSSLPFGFGPRMCLGRRLAEYEMYILLSRIFKKYRVEYHHGDVKRVFRGVSRPDIPLVFKFVER